MMSARNSFMTLLCSMLLANTLPAASFSGSVMDALDGTLLPGTEVELSGVNGTSWTAMTGEEGDFVIEAPAGRYDLHVMHPEYHPIDHPMQLPEAGLIRELALMPLDVEHALMTGYITDAETGEAVAGATVVTAEGLMAHSNQEGLYRLGGLVPTILEFQVVHPLYQLYEQTTFLEAGENQFDIQLTPGEIDPGTAWLLGNVVGIDWQIPIEGARVALDGDTLAITGPSGEYSIFQLEPGSYELSVCAEGFEPFVSPLSIEAGANHRRVVLEPLGGIETATLTGVVVDENGAGIVGVDLHVTNHGAGAVAECVSTEDGAFSFDALFAGEWMLTAHADGYLPYHDTVELSAGDNELAITMTTELNEESAGIEGYVLSASTGDPVSHANIVIHQENVATIVVVNGQGHFHSQLLSPGTASATVTHEGFATLVEEIELFENEVLAHDFILVPDEEPQTANLSGVVTDEATAEPLAGVTVSLTSMIYDCGASATTTEDGSYLIEEFCNGPATITVQVEGYLPYSTRIHMTQGDNVHDVTLVPFEQETASLSGRVTEYESGEGVSNAHVRVVSQTVWLFAETYTDEDGYYAVDDYVSGPSNFIVIVDDFPAYHETIDLDPGVNAYNCVLGDPGTGAASLSGYVTEVTSGEPIPDVEIVSEDYQFAISDLEGQYLFPELEPGETSFWVHHPFYGDCFSFTLNLEPGENVHDIELRLHGTGSEPASLLITTYNGLSGETLDAVEVYANGTQIGVTNDAGQLDLANISSGHLVLMALREGFSMAHDNVWLTPGENVVDLNLFPEIEEPHEVLVHGRVVDAVTRLPIAGAEVEVTLPDSQDAFVAVSDASGLYDLPLPLVETPYINVYCQVEGYEAREYEIFVQYRDVVELNVILLPENSNMGMIRGRVTYDGGHPAPAVVWAISADSYDYMEPVEASGSYTLMLPPGEYYIACSLIGAEGEQIYTEFYDDVMFLDDAESLSVEAGSVLPGINFGLPLMETINIHLTGQVTDETGTPLTDALVRFWRDDVELEEYATPTDQFGNYDVIIVMDRLPIVPFSFSAQYDGYLMEFFSDADSFVDATHFLLQDDVEIENADFSLMQESEATDVYTGRILNPAGDGLGSGMVAAFNPDGGVMAAVPTSADGSFSMRGLNDEPVVLMYYAPGHAPQFSGGSLDLDNATIAQPGYDGSENATLVTTADPNGVNQLTGVIRDVDGRPLSGALVIVQNVDTGELRSIFTNSAGRYAINGLATGSTYCAYISHQGYYSLQVTFATDSAEDLVNVVDAGLVSRTSTDVGENVLPETLRLLPNYPNPFNPTTTIPYVLPAASRVTLGVYNLQGELVLQLVDGVQPAGEFAQTFYAGNLASGVYFVRLASDAGVQTRKLMLIK